MKRWIAGFLCVVLVLAVLPVCSSAAVPITPVQPEQNDFIFSAGNGWSHGRTDGHPWAESASSDSSPAAAYVGAKLAGDWHYTVMAEPMQAGSGNRIVGRVNLLDRYKNPKVILTYEYLPSSKQTALTVQTISSANGGSWVELWRANAAGWFRTEDTALCFAFSKQSETEICLAVRGNCGYQADTLLTVPADVMKVLCYGGLAAERSKVRFSGLELTCDRPTADMAAAARTAYQNLLRNFADTDNKVLRDVVFGYLPGTVTNAGNTVPAHCAFWEVSIALMAMDTYIKTLNPSDPTYWEACTYIANTVDSFVSRFSEENLVVPASAPFNHAMDDCGWNVYALLLGYRYLTAVGRQERAATCLDYAKKLFHNSYDTYYDDDLGGGMWYNHGKTAKSVYASTLALAGYELYELTGDAEIYRRFTAIYNALENNLRRADGLYWMSETAEGFESAQNPYDISEGGSCTYLGGNLCMAVLNARMGQLEKAKVTCEGIALFETTDSNALLNDRDAWNNTFFLGYFVRELVSTGIADSRFYEIIMTTAQNILDCAMFEDGYYSAAWEGPREPSSSGYPSAPDNYWQGERNRWGIQNYENGFYIGSTPNQLMTTATTVHVLFAANALTAKPTVEQTPGDFGWDTDTVNHVKSFAGWTADSECCLRGNYAQSVANHRIWKNLVKERDSFVVGLTVQPERESSGYLRLMGVTLELDARGGDGNQVYVKLPGFGGGWLRAEDREVTVRAAYKNGTLRYTLVGKNAPQPMSLSAAAQENNENVELGLYAGATEFREIAVAEPSVCLHAWVLQEARSTPATCTADGTAVYVCAVCSTEKSEHISALQHEMQTDAAVAPSCTESGREAGSHCTRCDYTEGGAVLAALGHAWDEGTVTKEPTHLEEGEKTYTCTRCDAIKTEPLAKLADPCEGYTDLDRTAWYHSAVDFVIDGGYMGSTSTDKLTFAPTTKVSRAMVAQILYSIAGNGEELSYQGSFADIKEGQWYTNAVEWCAKNGLAAGSDGKFNPNGNVTRQELTVFMRSLAKHMGKDTTGSADLSGFPDANKVPAWAKEAVEWAVDYGIISGQKVGDKTYLNSTAGATRAELAAILKSFLTK